MTNVFRTVLLFTLLALGGEVLAQPCHSDDQSAMPVAETGNATQVHLASRDHCNSGACKDAADTGAPHDCGPLCSCCPGHCANALPASAADTEFPINGLAPTAYRPLDSSPAPESEIRPPIPA